MRMTTFKRIWETSKPLSFLNFVRRRRSRRPRLCGVTEKCHFQTFPRGLKDPWEGKEPFPKSKGINPSPKSLLTSPASGWLGESCLTLILYLLGAFTASALSAPSLTFKLGSLEDSILPQLKKMRNGNQKP